MGVGGIFRDTLIDLLKISSGVRKISLKEVRRTDGRFARKKNERPKVGRVARDIFLWGLRHPILLDPLFSQGSLHLPFQGRVSFPKNLEE